MKHEETARRLKFAMAQANIEAQELADKSKVSKYSISQYVNGRHTPSNISAGKMAPVLHVDPVWLMGFDVPMAKEVIQQLGTPTRIPVYGSVSAGNGTLADGNIEGFVDIPEDMAKHGDYFGLRIKGDSMEPDIKDGDTVIVRRTEDVPADGKTVIAIVNGNEGFCKKIAKYAEGLCLSSNNSNYPPKIYTVEQVTQLPVRIVGVVERLIRDF